MVLSPGARIEDAINKRVIPRLRAAGQEPTIIPFTGYGSTKFVRVLARTVMHDPTKEDTDDTREGRLEGQRGWRSFMGTYVGMLPVEITAGNVTVRTKSDRSGYIDVVIRKHGMEPGWQNVTIRAISGDETKTPVHILRPDLKYGLISDIDDTVMVTYLPRAFIAAWNTFVKHTATRQPVPGMAELYHALQERHPEMPVFYLSTGAWNVVPTLTRFLKANNYPDGPMLMTDWGPTNTGWFRSGQEHKRTQMRRLAIEFPKVKWFLVGDDGQHDPMLYREMARDHPEHVRAILIRELNPTEQFLAHGTFDELYHPDNPAQDELDRPVPFLAAPDGFELKKLLPAKSS
ncbi:MAG TPA: DUF2183 domain-containing protein [Actinomycetales bacterium]|nr:DUF2183 domain-containing protein [Actinomycetales bacterium]